MSALLQDSALGLRNIAAVSGPLAGKAGLEEEIVGMFEQFRGGLLRYMMALGLNSQDGEEVVQEVFLALFQHLAQAKSRHHLRGWIFRVAHNLGLKLRNRTLQQWPMDLNPAIRYLRAELEKLDRVIASLKKLASDPPSDVPVVKKGRGRKSMGAAERREVSARMKKYWAKRRVN